MTVDLDIPQYQQMVQVMRRPQPFPTAQWTPWLSKKGEDLAQELTNPPGWEAALGEQDVERLWTLWVNAAEAWLAKRSEAHLVGPTANYKGRNRCVERTHRVAAQTREAEPGALSVRHRRVLRLARQLEELSRHLTRLAPAGGPLPYLVVSLWAKAGRAGTTLLPELNWPADPPRLPALNSLTQQVRDASYLLQAQVRRDRIQQWRLWMQDGWQAEPGKVYRWVAGGRAAPTAMLQRDVGGVTANVAEMDAILQEAWGPIFRMYASRPEPAWEPFLARYEHAIPPASPMVAEPITAEGLRSRLDRTSTRRAAGLDGWRTAELKALPLLLLAMLAALLNVVEATGTWPDALLRTLVALIPKGEGSDPLQQRPISIASTVYRLWAGVRLQDAMRWQETWVLPGQHGCRLAHCTEDLYWRLALRVEEALLGVSPHMWGVSLDFSKCFDRVPQHIVMQVAHRMGAAPNVMRALEGMYQARVCARGSGSTRRWARNITLPMASFRAAR